MPPLGIELPKWVACAHIVAACASDDVADAVRHASAARESAEKYGSPFLRVVASVINAELVPQLRSERLAEALELAQQIESVPLQRALQAHIAGDSDTGMLAPLIARLRRDTLALPRPCDFLLLSGEVVIDGKRTAVSDRKLDLLAVLSQHRRGATREAIVERVWPEQDEDSGTNAFNCAYTRCASSSVSTRSPCTGQVRVWRQRPHRYLADRRLLSRARVAARSHGKPTRGSAPFLRAAVPPLPSRYGEFPWFAATERHIIEVRCEIAERLAREALASGSPGEALALARKIID